MKVCFSVLFFILVGQLNAQLAFFIRPSVNFKSNIASSESFHFSDFILNQTPYYNYDNIAFHNMFKSLDLSGSIGCKSKSNNYFFELGFSSDQTQSGYKMHSIIKNNDQSQYYSTMVSYSYGRSFPRVFLQNSFRLKEFKNKSSLYFIHGVSYGYKKNHVLEAIGITGETVQVDSQVFLERESAMSVLTLKNLFIHFGFSSQIYSKNKYLFDLSLFYNHGFNEMSHVTTKLTIYDNQNSKQIYYQSISKGSGLYLQFSRQLQIFPWKKKNKEGV